MIQKTFKHALLAGIIFFSASSITLVTVEAIKIAIVSFAKIFDPKTGALKWRDKVQELQKEMEPRIKKFQADQEKLKKLAEKLNNPATVWDNEFSKEAAVQEAIQLENTLKTAGQAAQAFEQKRAQEIQAMLFEDISKAVREVAAELGYDVVIAEGIIYANGKGDITDKVIERMNKLYSSEKAAKKFSKDVKKENVKPSNKEE